MMSVESMEDATNASLHSRLEQAASLAETNGRSGSAAPMDTEDRSSFSASTLVGALGFRNGAASPMQAAAMAAPGTEATHLIRAHRVDAGGNAGAQPSRQSTGRRLWHKAACDRAPTRPSLDDCFEESSSSYASEIVHSARPASPPRRRINRKRSQTDLAEQLNGKRLRDALPTEAAPALPEASEEDWRRRQEKRQSAILSIKASREYQDLSKSRDCGEPGADAVPGTPDPTDHSTSKRTWEASVMKWRNALKEWSAGRPDQPGLVHGAVWV